MKLTNAIRERMVRSILADIPRRDFQHEAEAVVLPAAIELLPAPVKRVYKDSATRPYVRHAAVRTDCGALYVQIPCCEGDGYSVNEPVRFIGEEAWAAFQKLCGENSEEKDSLRTAKRQLEIGLGGCSTDKQVRDRFPDLAKYLPAQEEVANLPATTAMIDSLKSLGWQPSLVEQPA